MAKGKATRDIPVRAQRVQRVNVCDLVDNASNFRVHEEDQTESLEATLNQIGWYGRPIVFATKGGKFTLVDGHLRTSLLRKNKVKSIEVLVVEFTPREALKALATFDPIADLASLDGAMLKAVLEKIKLEAEGVRAFLLEDLPMTSTPDYEPDGDGGGGGGHEGSGEVSGVVKYKCPQCGLKWQAKATDVHYEEDIDDE